MADYRKRIAQKMRLERERRGQRPIDVAYAIGVDKRTYERWEGAEVEPRLSNLRALAEEWGVEIKDLRPDLEAEEEQLSRIEEKLDALLEWAETGEIEAAVDQLPATGEEEANEAGR